MRYTKLALLALLAAGAFMLPAAAQDEGGLRPLKPGEDQPPIEDLGGWLGDDEKPAPRESREEPEDYPEEVEEEEPDPLSPGSKRELSPVERKRRQRSIDRNYRDAQKNYRDILGSDPVAPLDRRIKNNERIIREYTARIRRSVKERRQMQVQLYNRTFYLKQQLDRKQITRGVYERLLAQEEQKFEAKNASFKKNVSAWRKEIKVARTRLNNLRAQRRLLMAQRPRRRTRSRKGKRGSKGVARGKPGSRLLGNLQQRLRKVARYTTKHTLAGVHPRDLGIGSLSRKKKKDSDDAEDAEVAPDDETLEEPLPEADQEDNGW